MRILVSACLLGIGCRYDGAHRGLPAELLRRLMAQHTLVPACPEQLGGLPTPRDPSERQGTHVRMRTGRDVTAEYRRGAAEALRLAESFGCTAALLKARSPSCGSGQVYDGTFSGTLTDGDGVTAELFRQHGIAVYSVETADALLQDEND